MKLVGDWVLYYFVRDAIKKYYPLGGLNKINVFFHSSGSYKSKIKMSFSSEASVFGS